MSTTIGWVDTTKSDQGTFMRAMEMAGQARHTRFVLRAMSAGLSLVRFSNGLCQAVMFRSCPDQPWVYFYENTVGLVVAKKHA